MDQDSYLRTLPKDVETMSAKTDDPLLMTTLSESDSNSDSLGKRASVDAGFKASKCGQSA